MRGGKKYACALVNNLFNSGFLEGEVPTVFSRLKIPAHLCSLLTYISLFRFAPRRVKDKVLCAVWVFWPPVHSGSWWSSAKKTRSSFCKTKKTSELWCHKSMKAFLWDKQNVRKATKMRFICFYTDRQPLQAEQAYVKKWRFGSSDWLLCPKVVLAATALIKQLLKLLWSMLLSGKRWFKISLTVAAKHR